MRKNDEWHIGTARAALLIFLILFGAGQTLSWLRRPIVPEEQLSTSDLPWPPAVTVRILDATAAKTNRLEFFPSGTTVYEAITFLALTADPAGSGTVLPRAGVLFPTAEGWTVRPMSQRERHVWGIPMDLNAAGEEDLVRIPGIGPILARRLLDYISRRIWVPSVSELDRVPGIGPSKLKVLSEYLEVE